jgi:hypothetical protein
VVQSVSPACAFKFKGKLSSDLSNLLSSDFDYSKSGGEIILEFDIDHTTMKKIKEILGDKIEDMGYTPESQIMTLLFEELKLDAEFHNLGEALASAFQIEASELPKPGEQLGALKEMNLKENAEMFNDGGPNIISQLNENCEAEGEVSLNLHDFFFKLSFDIHIKNAFDYLG